jgi:formylmethanofuran dehydrogenase subunit C
MSEVVTLTLRARVEGWIELDHLRPDRCAGLDEADIAALPVSTGRHTARLGDFFDVRGGRSARVRIEGASTGMHGLATRMAGGELTVDGNAGDRMAFGMTGGAVVVLGNVGDDAGVAMGGGTLHVRGGAGDRLAAAAPGAAAGMTGGEIVVGGAAGDGAGARLRRGLVVVAGDAGAHAGRGMIAGTIVVLGTTGESPGRGSRRGSIIAAGPITIPATYRYACTYDPPYVRLLMSYLVRRYALAIARPVVEGPYLRYCGDLGRPGKGEILESVSA